MTLFVGFELKDNHGKPISSKKTYYKERVLFDTTNSNIVGTASSFKSPEISIGGPVKGSYAVIQYATHYYEYVREWGFRVEDPCKTPFNGTTFYVTKTHERDLQYHTGTDSAYWLTQCKGNKELQLSEHFSWLFLGGGILRVHSIPKNETTKLLLTNRAPDQSQN